jgi:hypothetical protein
MSKISEVIKKLEEKKNVFGDIDVVYYDEGWKCYFGVCADDEDFVVGDLLKNNELQLTISGISPFDEP